MHEKCQGPTASGLIALAIVALLAGCATPIRTEPVVSDGQERIYRDGLPALISRKQFVVLVSPATVVREGKERLRLIVSVRS